MSPREMAAYCKGNLVNYMIPRAFLLEALLTGPPQGKTDYPSLRILYEEKLRAIRAHVMQCKPSAGNRLAELKYSVSICVNINMDEINMEDNFFDLGGNSANMTQLWLELRQFGWTLKMSQLLTATTLREMFDRGK